MREVTIRELMAGIQLETGTTHSLRLIFPALHLRLPIDPSLAEHWDDRFILTIDRKGTKTESVMTVKDDHVPGDAYVDLIFKRLMPDARYTLTVHPGGDEPPHAIFEDRAYDELFSG
jgi:hypothetical protein